MVKRGDVITVKKVGDLPVLGTDDEGIVLRTPIGPAKIEVGYLFGIQDTVFITPSQYDSTGAIIQIRPTLHDTEPT
jgi:hypothetical protein